MADGYIVKPKDVVQVEMLDGIQRRTMATTDEAMLCQFELKANSIVPLHHHMNDQIGYIISGKIEITIGDTVAIICAGDSYAVPGGIKHSVRALEPTVAIDIFSPPREDYRTEAR